MTDLAEGKSTSSAEEVFIVPSAPLTAGSVVQGIETPPKEAKSSSGLNLSEKNIEFLQSPYRQRFLTEFKIGRSEITLYGNPIEMSLHCTLMKSLLGPMSDSKPPYIIGPGVVMMRNPLVAVWLYLNSRDLNHETISELSFDEWINMFEIMNYFGIGIIGSMGVSYLWRYASRNFNDQKVTKKEIDRNSNALIKILNYMRRSSDGVERYYDNMLSWVIGLPEILSKLQYIPIVRVNHAKEVAVIGNVERKNKDNIPEVEKEVNWTAKRHVSRDGKVYYTFPNDRATYNITQLRDIVVFAPKGMTNSAKVSAIQKTSPQ